MKDKIINFWRTTSTKIRVILTTLVILVGLAFVGLCVYGVVFVVISATQNGSFW
ncbi:hypothetical protein [Mycoplasmoides gallisepticum]|uniref:Uncharacterized protein n=1 Tax=Mycoplasmoides gallisepticum S6 TaxID=1006581 RepID=A0A0F6CLK3_MYCGL|nr:hypothetical protein [Mycoplasmoides gallisepticum]AHB99975.1 hypothetical protein GCW_00195 [Mycoplasmoides gallisepticum S6]